MCKQHVLKSSTFESWSCLVFVKEILSFNPEANADLKLWVQILKQAHIQYDSIKHNVPYHGLGTTFNSFILFNRLYVGQYETRLCTITNFSVSFWTSFILFY